MISPSAVASFRARPLKDSAIAKQFSEAALDEKLIRKLPKGFRFRTEQRYAQKVCTLLGLEYMRYAFLLGLGGGKTKSALDVFTARRVMDGFNRSLVVVPNVVNLYEWEEQVHQHCPAFRPTVVDQAGTEARVHAIETGGEVTIITYAGLYQLLSSRMKKRKGKGNTLEPSAGKIKWCAQHFDMLILDESTEIRNHLGLPFRIVRGLAKYIPGMLELTGTPFGLYPEGLWSQFRLIDGGHALGETLGLFRAAFFRETWNGFGNDWVFRKNLEPVLHRRLRHCSIRFREDECQDLPEAMGGLAGDDFLLVKSRLPAQQRQYYDVARKQLQSLRYGEVTACEQAYTRMRTLSSGWLGATTDDDSRVEIIFKENPKLDALVQKLHELDPNERVFIVHWYGVTGRIITERLKKEKIGHVHVYGKTSTNEKRKRLAHFKSADGPRVLVGSTALSKGVNLQAAARHMFFFETPDDPIERQQLEGRIRREGGLSGRRWYWDFVSTNTKDEDVLHALREGRTGLAAIVDGLPRE